MENAFVLSQPFRRNFSLSPQNYTIGVIYHEYCQIRAEGVVSAKECRHRETTFLFLKLFTAAELSYKEIMQTVERVLNPIVRQNVTRDLRRIRLFGLDSLLESLERLSSYLKGHTLALSLSLNPHSLVGIFLRKLALSMKTLDFGSLVCFADELRKYLSADLYGLQFDDDLPIRRLSASLQDISLAFNGSEANEANEANDWPIVRSIGRNQARTFLRTQAIRLRDNPGLAAKPNVLERTLAKIRHRSPELDEAYYMSYLNQLLFGEYSSAVDNCHKFFLRKQDETGKSYRFSLLNLAMIHRRFGHIQQAEIALRECIDLSQESGDKDTLKQAFNWLHCSNYKALSNDPVFSVDLSEPLCSLNASRLHDLFDRVPLSPLSPSRCFEKLHNKWLDQKSASLNIIAHDIAEALLWIGYGFHENAKLHCEMILHMCRSKVRSSHDSWIVINESAILALVFLSRYAMLDYEGQLADRFMRVATSLTPEHLELRDIVDITLLCNRVERALRKERYETCAKFIDSMALISRPVAQLYQARLQHQRANYSCALQLLDSVQCNADCSEVYPIKWLLKSRVLLDAGSDNVIDSILKGLGACERFHLSYLGALFKLELVRYQHRSGFAYKDLRATLRPVIPLILAHCSKDDKLRLEKVLAEITPDPRKSIDRMHNCFKKWNRLGDVFNQRLALDYMARKAHSIGDRNLRNGCAKMFRDLITMEHLT